MTKAVPFVHFIVPVKQKNSWSIVDQNDGRGISVVKIRQLVIRSEEIVTTLQHEMLLNRHIGRGAEDLMKSIGRRLAAKMCVTLAVPHETPSYAASSSEASYASKTGASCVRL